VTYGFSVGKYDPAQTLVLDPAIFVYGCPVINYCGYIGGASQDYGNAIAVDVSGCAYITGRTHSNEFVYPYFPVYVGPGKTFMGGNYDAFVAKINADGSEFVYCGYIGGSGGHEAGNGIAVDSSGCAYVTGSAESSKAEGFPVTDGSFDSSANGNTDAFVAKVSPTGTELVYCGYIGGSGDDYGTGIAVNASGCAYVTGYTYSDQTTFRVIDWPPSCVNYNGNGDAFVAQVNADGTDLNHCGYIGGGGDDYGNGIAVDAYGNAYVTGDTQFSDPLFPVIVGPDLIYNGGYDAFVTKISNL